MNSTDFIIFNLLWEVLDPFMWSRSSILLCPNRLLYYFRCVQSEQKFPFTTSLEDAAAMLEGWKPIFFLLYAYLRPVYSEKLYYFLLKPIQHLLAVLHSFCNSLKIGTAVLGKHRSRFQLVTCTEALFTVCGGGSGCDVGGCDVSGSALRTTISSLCLLTGLSAFSTSFCMKERKREGGIG